MPWAAATAARARGVTAAWRAAYRARSAVGQRLLKARYARRAALLGSPIAVATAARYWRSYQELEDGDLAWPDDSCVSCFGDVLELAERSALFSDGVLALDEVRRWHIERGYRGGVVVRSLHEPSDEHVDLCYYMYYELSGSGELEQQIFIRGTSNKEDLAVDFETRKAWDPETGCYFHAGFLKRAERVLEDVGPLLQPRAVLTLSGHSLGGAVATCVALKLQLRSFQIRRVVTFGAPKITNAEGVDVFRNLPLLRVCHEDDVIVGLPPASLGELVTASWKGVYHHVGPQLLLASAPGQACFLGSETCFQWWNHSCFFLLSSEMISAHRIYTYVARLNELCDGRACLLPFNACWPRSQAGTELEATLPSLAEASTPTKALPPPPDQIEPPLVEAAQQTLPCVRRLTIEPPSCALA